MQELIAKISEIINKLDGFSRDFQFKNNQLEEDINIISKEFGEGASSDDKNYISSLNAGKNRYRDAVDTLQIAKQRLEEVLSRLS